MIGTNKNNSFLTGMSSVHAQWHHSDAAKGGLGIKAIRFPMQLSEL